MKQTASSLGTRWNGGASHLLRRCVAMMILLLLSATAAMAQRYTLSGRVADSTSGEPLAFVNVALSRVGDTLFVRGATTGDDGRFTIDDVDADEYLMVLSMVGYEPWCRPMRVTASRDVGTLRLHAGTVLRTVEVVAAKPLYSMDGEKNIYNTGDDPSIQTGTVSDALQNAPGIEVDANGNITLRGKESVVVWINDKPSHLEGEALKQYIKTLPANAIERIEVITNPSARYGGGTPVVNIVTSRKVMLNRFVSFGLNGSTAPNLIPWLSYVYSNEKLTVNLYAQVGSQVQHSHASTSAVIRNDAGDTAYTEQTDVNADNYAIAPYLGLNVDYNFDERNTLSAWLGGYGQWDSWEQQTTGQRIVWLGNAGNYSYSNRTWYDVARRPSFVNGWAGAVYSHQFDDTSGHRLDVSLNSYGWNRDFHYNRTRSYSWQPALDFDYRTVGDQGGHSISADVDYVLPFGRRDTATAAYANELQAGLSVGYDQSIDLLNTDSLGLHSDNLYHDCDYLSHYALMPSPSATAYATYLHRWGRLSVKVGLRYDAKSERLRYYRDADAEAPRVALSDGRYDLDVTSGTLTPSLHLSYRTRNQHNFALSYTRRTTKPSASDLTTFVIYDVDSYSTGNAALRPSYSDKVEIKWDKYLPHFGALGLQAYYTGNLDEQGTLSDVAYSDVYGRMVQFSQPVNVGSSYNAGLDVNLTYRPSAFINVRLNGSLYYDYLDFDYRNGADHYSNGMWCYNARLNVWAKVWKRLQIFANINYNSPTQSVLSVEEATKNLLLGMESSFFDDHLTVSLMADDIFGWKSYGTATNSPYLVSSSTGTWNSRMLWLSVTVRLGRMELASKAREGGNASSATPR